MEKSYFIVSGGDGYLAKVVAESKVPEVFKEIFGTDGDGEIPYLDTFNDKDEWDSHDQLGPTTLYIDCEDGYVRVYLIPEA